MKVALYLMNNIVTCRSCLDWWICLCEVYLLHTTVTKQTHLPSFTLSSCSDILYTSCKYLHVNSSDMYIL